ncbi:iron-sulfur cluster-binding protein [Helicobacter pylori]|uniref:LutB/LldF family L-lactate oxidation iron-sulfur protein n=1 Tax=Helicobacter pylori TaxID=210 RepID=UPI000FDF64EE|nr:LutB/LldF family L-lactate oxidation iron-sulfur protein [Helicobacter pylori]RVY12815.1 iron-sulfur cluster-binding protein [Helicobacter pylori]RVY15891.1 iron-sulfur cluster-binding protein [Helicobacter pylori]RVY20256.1 iron-sulfur cluster-binding protein [Helicobacter pylori]RVY93268.1 iron-sulfur cluster-binding protein [Helicobacter pylori]
MEKYHSDQEYEEIITDQLGDMQLRENLRSAMDTLRANRKNLIKNRYSEWENLRELGKEVKLKILSRLDEYLELFEKNATQNGFKIHYAKDGDEANEIIYNLAKEKNIKRILKQKSMASEEIGLNHYLKEKGIQAQETDLGELIIQLINEHPVHIVVPAIHKNRKQIGKIFEEKLNAAYEEEPEKLNAIARKHMRKEFESFKMGISGVNFAIANEGAIWLVENEGNGRMSTTACDVHVAICGIEKLVESFDDAAILNNLLAPSAVGVPITCYQNIITGPRKEGDLDGPKEAHIILLDNNRSNILADEKYYRALSCIRCGTCLNHCPVYDKIGGHAYLSTYPGPIGVVVSPQLFGLNNYGHIPNLCSLCGRCTEVCPVEIPLAELIRDLRADKVGEGRGIIKGAKSTQHSGMEKFSMKMFAKMASDGVKWRFQLKMAQFFSPLGKLLAPILPLVKEWASVRTLPNMDTSLHAKVQHLEGVIYE